MTPKAIECIKKFYGANPVTIKNLLMQMSPSLVEELKNHYGTSNI